MWNKVSIMSHYVKLCRYYVTLHFLLFYLLCQICPIIFPIMSNYSQLFFLLFSIILGCHRPVGRSWQTHKLVQCTEKRLTRSIEGHLALISRAWLGILNICRFSNGPFLNLGATCFCTEWRASANFRRLLLRDSPSSQPPRLPKINLGTALPTRCTNSWRLHSWAQNVY